MLDQREVDERVGQKCGSIMYLWAKVLIAHGTNYLKYTRQGGNSRHKERHDQKLGRGNLAAKLGGMLLLLVQWYLLIDQFNLPMHPIDRRSNRACSSIFDTTSLSNQQ